MPKVWKTVRRKNGRESATRMRNRVNKKFEPGDREGSTNQSPNDANNATLASTITFKTPEQRGRTRNVSPFDTQKTQSVDAAARITTAMAKSMQVARDRNSWNQRKPL